MFFTKVVFPIKRCCLFSQIVFELSFNGGHREQSDHRRGIYATA